MRFIEFIRVRSSAVKLMAVLPELSSVVDEIRRSESSVGRADHRRQTA